MTSYILEVVSTFLLTTSFLVKEPLTGEWGSS